MGTLRVFVVAGLAVLTLRAQAPVKADAEFLRKAYDTYTSMRQASPYRGDELDRISGPTNISGRVTDIAVADSTASAASTPPTRRAACGRPTTTARRGRPIFEQMPSTSIGDIAVAPSNPDIVWVGTGEANIFRASMPGAGIYKSTDAGRRGSTWASPTRRRSRAIVVHPTNPDIVYVAAVGPRVDRQRDARRLQDDRRRPDVDEGAATAARAPARSIS